MTHMERIEWAIYKVNPDGTRVRHLEGAQSVFGLTRARKIIKELGREWSIWHATEPARRPED